MDVVKHNRDAWDREVERGNQWTVPVTAEDIAAARQGRWHIVLTPIKPVPRDWFPDDLTGARVLCLASGGGQQGPILAAAGARVTVFDNSPRQLGQDRMVAERDGLDIELVEGDMADLGVFADGRFDLIVHPASNCFVPDVRPVWREAFRVLAPGGALLAGFANPAIFIFAEPWGDAPNLEVSYTLPYDERTSISAAKRQEYIAGQEPLLFSHTLDALLGGQIAAGFAISGFYEDGNPEQRLADYMPTFMATRAVKPAAAGA